MPRIPITTAAVDLSDTVAPLGARLRDSAPAPDQQNTAALGKVGAQAENLGAAINRLDLEQQSFDRGRQVANAVANTDYETPLLTAQTQAAPGAPGFTQTMADVHDNITAAVVDAQEDPVVRKEVEEKLNAMKPGFISRSAQFQVQSGATLAKDQSSAALGNVINAVRADASSLPDNMQKGTDVINSQPNIPAETKVEMVRQFKSQITTARFESLGQSATDPDQIAGIIRDMQDPSKPYQADMEPQVFNTMLDKLKTDQKAAYTLIESQARAQLKTVTERIDKNLPVDPATMSAIAASAAKSKNPSLQLEAAEMGARNTTIINRSALPPSALRDQLTNPQTAYPQLPAALNTSVQNAVAATGGKVSAPLLVGLLAHENRGMLSGGAAAPGNGGGAGQFIPSTWLGQPGANNGIVNSLGIDVSGMSDQQKLDLRQNTDLNLKGMAVLATQNKSRMETALGRPVNDAEVSLAHFLGAGGSGPGKNSSGAIDIIQAFRTNPMQTAASVTPAAAAANHRDFYNADGSPKTVQKFYADEALAFGTTPTRVGFAINDQTKKILDKQTEALKSDPVSYATQQPGTRFSATSLAQPEQLGQTATAISDYYGIPHENMRPLTTDQADTITKTVKDGTADDQLGQLATINRMGADMAKAALKQIGETNPTFGYVGALQANGGAPGVARDALLGMTRIRDDKAINEAQPMKQTDMRQDFDRNFGPALSNLSGASTAALYDAARAHYAETFAKNNLSQGFSTSDFGKSVGAVLGGSANAPRIGYVNGSQTVTPPGVTPKQMDDAVHNMSDADFQALSTTGQPPLFSDGSKATAQQIQSQGVFKFAGGSTYNVFMGDGKPLLAFDPVKRQTTYYQMSMKPEQVLPIAQRTGPAPVRSVSALDNIGQTP